MTRPRIELSGAGSIRARRGAATFTRTRPEPKIVSGPGTPRSTARPVSCPRTSAALGNLPARRSAASSTAAAPAAFGAAIDVPPTERWPFGPMSRVSVGAMTSGFTRPSSVGPCEE